MSTVSTTGLYPFDPYGNKPENLVLNELQALQVPGRDDFYFIIPKAAPFFVRSLVVRNDATGDVYNEGVDYVIGHYFVEAMNKTGQSIAGSIRFLRRDISGIVSLTYQTLGGEWGFDDTAILAELSNKMVNPLTRAWAQVDTLPAAFPPIPHDQRVDDLIGFGDVVEAVGNIVSAIEQTEDSQFTQHMLATDNPHSVTKAQVGLGNIENYLMASDAEGETGTRSDRFMSPRSTSAAIQEQALTPLTNHLGDYGNPHNVTKAQVGLDNVENYPMASDQEAKEASLTNRYVNPRGVGQALNEFYDTRLAPLLSGDPDNPTGVTKETIGLGNVENYVIATLPEMVAGSRNDRYTTPLRVWEAIDYHALIPLAQHESDTTNPHNVTPQQIGTLSTSDITTLVEGRLAVGGTAYNADRVFGMDQNALYGDIRSGTVDNSLHLEGNTLQQVLDAAANQTVENSTMFDGLTAEQWTGEIQTVVENSLGEGGAGLVTTIDFDYAAVGEFVLVAQRSLVDDGVGGTLPIYPTSVVMTYGEADGSSPYLQLNINGLTDPVTLVSINNETFPLEVFSTLDTTNNQLNVWVKVPPEKGKLHFFPVTEIDSRTFRFVQLLDPAEIEGDGSVEATDNVLATLSGLSPTAVTVKDYFGELMGSLTDAFDQAANELS